MRRSRRVTSLVLFAVLTLTLGFAAAAPAAGGARGELALAVLDIDRIGPDRLDAIKATPAVSWWVEVDRELLVCGPRDALSRALSGRKGFRVLEGQVRADELYFTKRYSAEDLARVGARLLVTDGTASVVQATPAQIEALGHLHGGDHAGEEGCRGHSAIVPFEPNAELAHQAANSRVASKRFDVSVQALVDEVDGDRWFADDQQLATFNRWSRGSGIAAARDWLVGQFSAMPGLEVSTQPFTVSGSPSVTAYNVIAKLPGTTRPDDWILFGAHYDSISTNDGHATAPGAEDNGSGTAAMLELARIFTENRPDATMFFICYAGEEQGLFGSEAHAQSLVASGDSTKVRAMFNLDMIGYTGDADLDCLIETRSVGFGIRDALVAAAGQYTSLRIVTSNNPCCSDHMPYINRNMPAVLSIENDYSTYPGYHRSNDLPSNITVAMAVEIMKMNVAAAAEMAGTIPEGLGAETAGVYNPATSTFFLRNANAPGGADAAFSFGGGALVPLAGDWNGDGVDTIGLYDPATSTFFLRNQNAPGGADAAFSFGAGGAGLAPLVGDWNGDGTDTVGLYDPATGAFFLRNLNAPGGADVVFTYGPAGATAVAGDWNGDGATTIGVYVPSTGAWFLRNTNSAGGADLVFSYGAGGAGLVPLAGDWNGDRQQTVGLYDPAAGAWFLRNSNSAGGAHAVFSYGPAPGMRPVPGDWDGQ